MFSHVDALGGFLHKESRGKQLKICATEARDQSRATGLAVPGSQSLTYKLKIINNVLLESAATGGFPEPDLPGGSNRTTLRSGRVCPIMVSRPPLIEIQRSLRKNLSF